MLNRTRSGGFKLSISLMAAGCAIAGFPLYGMAQQQVPLQNNPGLVMPNSPELLPDTARKDRQNLPTPPTQTPDEKLKLPAPDTVPLVQLDNPDFMLKHIVVEGNTVVSNDEIQPLITPYENKVVNLNELGKLVDALNKLYYSKGYYTSQAYIPPQDIDKQTITVKIMEGHVGKVTISGNRFLKAQAVIRDTDLKQGEILNVVQLQERLRRIGNQSGYYKLKGVLTPGPETSQTDVDLKVAERFPLQISPTFDNQGRPHIGTYRTGIELDHSDLTGHGDHFNARWIAAAGTQIAAGSYFIPINKYGTQVGSTFSFSQVDINLHTSNQPKIIGRAYDYAGVVVQPLNPSRSLISDASLNFRRINTFFDGQRDPGSTVNIAAMRFGLTFNKADRLGRTYMRLQSSVAPGWMGANRKFWKNEMFTTRLVTLPHRNLLILRGHAQLTPDDLPAAEMMQIGGAYSVRGFSEGLLAGDSGYNFGVEHRWPIPGLQRVSPWLANRVQGASFFDFGNVWIHRGNPLYVSGLSNMSQRKLLMGTGVGFRARVSSMMEGFVDLGWGLTNQGRVEPNAQPSFRVHFGLRANLLPTDYRDWTVTNKANKNAANKSATNINAAAINAATLAPAQSPLFLPPAHNAK
jgi:hemolysin activation/secretion protein